jgi:hypothetical protein
MLKTTLVAAAVIVSLPVHAHERWPVIPEEIVDFVSLRRRACG